ncbi:hypothetical protein ACHAO7_011515 [Fusarium culmorum]
MHATHFNATDLTNDDLCRQILKNIFGWDRPVEELIRDEMSRHPQKSASSILLARWLGETDLEIINPKFEDTTSSDWMLLALSVISGDYSEKKLVNTYVQGLLKAYDVHTAATIMLGIGDHDKAIEAYVSRQLYLEALILTCLLAPYDWDRQSAIVEKWSELAVQCPQEQLAIQCFACIGQKPTGRCAFSSVARVESQTMNINIPKLPLSTPPSSVIQLGSPKSIAKTLACKPLIPIGEESQNPEFVVGDGDEAPESSGISKNKAQGARWGKRVISKSSHGHQLLPTIMETLSDDLEAQNDYGGTRCGGSNAPLGVVWQRAATARPMMTRELSQQVEEPTEIVQELLQQHGNECVDYIIVGLDLED